MPGLLDPRTVREWPQQHHEAGKRLFYEGLSVPPDEGVTLRSKFLRNVVAHSISYNFPSGGVADDDAPRPPPWADARVSSLRPPQGWPSTSRFIKKESVRSISRWAPFWVTPAMCHSVQTD